MSHAFSKATRGPVVKPDPNKTRITIRLDKDIVKFFKDIVLASGGGNYQSLINDALREHIVSKNDPLEDTLRKVIREELRHAN